MCATPLRRRGPWGEPCAGRGRAERHPRARPAGEAPRPRPHDRAGREPGRAAPTNAAPRASGRSRSRSSRLADPARLLPTPRRRAGSGSPSGAGGPWACGAGCWRCCCSGSPSARAAEGPWLRHQMERILRRGTSVTWCTPEGHGMEQDTGRMAGESTGGQDLVSPTRAPCLSNTGLLLPPPTLLRPITVVLPAS